MTVCASMHIGYRRKRLSRVTLVPQYGKAVERFVNIRIENAFV